MRIKVISRGNKGRVETAQIVVTLYGRSRTVHVWKRHGNVYGDWLGNNYTLD